MCWLKLLPCFILEELHISVVSDGVLFILLIPATLYRSLFFAEFSLIKNGICGTRKS